MEEVITIDLREKPRSCTEHPLVKLTKALKELKKGRVVKVITDNKIVPIETIKVLAKKNNLKYDIVKENSLYILHIVKQ